MAKTATAATPPKARSRATEQRSSHDHQRDFVDLAHGCAVAGFVRALRCLGNSVRTLLRLAQTWVMATAFRASAAASRCRWQSQLGQTLRRWQCHPCAPTCGRGKKGPLDPDSALSALKQVQDREALGRSQGGLSTKLQRRCDGNGLPITFLVTVGERHETVVFEQLMEQGAVKRSGAGRPRLRSKRVSGDKGSSSGNMRR